MGGGGWERGDERKESVVGASYEMETYGKLHGPSA